MVRKAQAIHLTICNICVETFIETETVNVDTTIITFTATDDDQPGTSNSRILYYADQRDDNQLFVLNPITV